MSARVLLADDHPVVLQGLRALLDGLPDFEVVAEAADGLDAVNTVLRTDVDLAILDVSMPRLTGVDAARQIKANRPDVSVLMLSMHDSEQYLFAALAAGASGYVLKQSPFDVLLSAIAATASGQQFVDPAIGTVPPRTIVERPSRVAASDREMSVLRLAATGKSNKDIASALNIAVKTVEVHKANAMRKLQLKDREELVQFAVMNGWLRDA
jgi:DNA-binding NarL/FixJ family response regulator